MANNASARSFLWVFPLLGAWASACSSNDAADTSSAPSGNGGSVGGSAGAQSGGANGASGGATSGGAPGSGGMSRGGGAGTTSTGGGANAGGTTGAGADGGLTNSGGAAGSTGGASMDGGATPPPNLVFNPSFELGSGADADGWTEMSSLTRDGARAHDGTWSLKAVAAAGGNSASSVTLAVAPNTTYRLSGYIYRTNAAGSTYLDLNDAPSDPNPSTNAVGTWQYVSATWTSGSITSVTVRCVTENVTGDVWFDDLSFAAVDPGTVPPPTTTAYGYSAHTLGQGDRDTYVALAEGGGATTIRDDFAWAGIEPSKGVFDWNQPDTIVSIAAAHGLSVLAMAGYGAAWATGCAATKCGPSDPVDYGEFVRQIALRYGHTGTYWTDHPTVPRHPLSGIEIWNEPNLDGFWSNPDAASYTATLKAAYTAIKSADPKMTVVSAGLSPFSNYPTVNNPRKFLETMYQNGAHGFMDAVGFHPYYFFAGATADQMTSGGSWAEMYLTSPSMRSLMEDNGDSALRIWATELGAPTWSGGVTEAEQGNLATREVALWKTFPWAGNYYWYDLRDDGTDPTDREHHFGAVRHDSTKKPAYDALKVGWTTP